MRKNDVRASATGARLRNRSVAHQLAAWWGLLGVAWVAALWVGGVLSLPASATEAARSVTTVVAMIGVPAVGAWLATRPRLATPLALPPAAVVATHAVEHAAGNLHQLVELAAAPISSEAVATTSTIFAVHVIAAMAAVAAMAGLATRHPATSP